MKPEIDPLNVPILAEHQSSPSSTLTTLKSKLTKRMIIPSVVSGAIALGLISFVCSLTPPVPVTPTKLLYSVIIDAGSSGSRVHVFRYFINESGEPVFNFGSRYYTSSRFDDGLSTFANDLQGARVKVEELVNFAQTKVPELMRHKSDIRLMATAGMRMIDKVDREKILDVIKQVLGSSGFNFHNDWATIISGSDEGLYAWVIANHALGSLGGDPLQTTGIVELGGASVQVTFVSSDLHVFPVDSRKKSYKSVPYRIYSHSFNDYGKDAALKRLMTKLQKSATGDENVQDPCTPKGYSYQNNAQKYLSVFLADESEYTKLTAAGDFEECKKATDKLLKERNGTCPETYSCAIGSTYTPPLQGEFLGMASIFFTSKFFNLNEEDWLSELRQKGDEFCQKDWGDLKKKYEKLPHYDEEHLRGYCFSSAYIISMMDRLGVTSQRMKYSNEENNIPLSWALGAFIDTASRSIAPAPAPTPTYNNGGNTRKFLGLSLISK